MPLKRYWHTTHYTHSIVITPSKKGPEPSAIRWLVPNSIAWMAADDPVYFFHLPLVSMSGLRHRIAGHGTKSKILYAGSVQYKFVEPMRVLNRSTMFVKTIELYTASMLASSRLV